jgi:hypothetical protein
VVTQRDLMCHWRDNVGVHQEIRTLRDIQERHLVYRRLQDNGEPVGLADTVGTSACRQSPPETGMDYRVISIHTRFTPVPPPAGGVECS